MTAEKIRQLRYVIRCRRQKITKLGIGMGVVAVCGLLFSLYRSYHNDREYFYFLCAPLAVALAGGLINIYLWKQIRRLRKRRAFQKKLEPKDKVVYLALFTALYMFWGLAFGLFAYLWWRRYGVPMFMS